MYSWACPPASRGRDGRPQPTPSERPRPSSPSLRADANTPICAEERQALDSGEVSVNSGAVLVVGLTSPIRPFSTIEAVLLLVAGSVGELARTALPTNKAEHGVVLRQRQLPNAFIETHITPQQRGTRGCMGLSVRKLGSCQVGYPKRPQQNPGWVTLHPSGSPWQRHERSDNLDERNLQAAVSGRNSAGAITTRYGWIGHRPREPTT